MIPGAISLSNSSHFPLMLYSNWVNPVGAATHTVPIVFAIVPDPVGAGFVDSMARPGRNATGFGAVSCLLPDGGSQHTAAAAIGGNPPHQNKSHQIVTRHPTIL